MTSFLLDTQILLWWVQGESRLSDRVKSVLTDDANNLYFSIVSLWEITIKLNIGKLKIAYTLADIYAILERIEVTVLAITHSDLEAYLTLPLHHRDPFDRILVAQALERSLIIVSADEILSQYPVQRLWE